MDKDYEEIERVESDISTYLKGVFLKERLLFGEMAELVLEAFKPLGENSQHTSKEELAILTLASRIFNSSEAAKHLLLWGLPNQAQPIIRDIIECLMLFRLFIRNPKRAKKWLISLTEYQPGSINAMLLELGIEAKEYSLYGVLSHMGHSNLLASLSHIQELDAGEKGVLHVAHFGSARTNETLYFIHQGFILIFYLLFVALHEPLAELCQQYLGTDDFTTWSQKVDDLTPNLIDITAETTFKLTEGTPQVDPMLRELIFNKMRIKRNLPDKT